VTNLRTYASVAAILPAERQATGGFSGRSAYVADSGRPALSRSCRRSVSQGIFQPPAVAAATRTLAAKVSKRQRRGCTASYFSGFQTALSSLPAFRRQTPLRAGKFAVTSRQAKPYGEFIPSSPGSLAI